MNMKMLSLSAALCVSTPSFAGDVRDTLEMGDNGNQYARMYGPNGYQISGALTKTDNEKTGYHVAGCTYKEGVCDPNAIWVLRKYGANAGLPFMNAFNTGSGE